MALNPLGFVPRGRPALRGWLALLGSLLGACRAVRETPTEPLPFHVALEPTEVQEEPMASPGEAHDLRLVLGGVEVAGALALELEGTFVRTTQLQPPADAAAFQRLDARAREAYWQDAARAEGANLLLRSRLIHDGSVADMRNEKFWLNLPLFLLGGPMCYFVGDRSYLFSARLQVQFFEVTEHHETLEEHALLPIPLYSEHEGFDLNFLARADGVGSYLASLLVPAGLLARENEKIERTLARRLPQALGEELAGKVQRGRGAFERNPELGGIALGESRSALARGADGCVRVQLPLVALEPEGALLRYELLAGDTPLARGTRPRADERVPAIDVTVAPPPEARFLTLRLFDAAANARSYTLRIAVDER